MPLTDITNKTRKCRVQLDDYICGLIIDRFQADQSHADIERAIQIPRSTIADCINRWKKTGTGIVKSRKGRPLKLSERDQRAIVRSRQDQYTFRDSDQVRCYKRV
ncbi:hypothetical protein INT48_007937 [Thamnidium elegans]|uniref:Homeodomain-like DNA binding domain-containing transcription factor n=1 Tax=Thamnidium elegans TaxID=101142 RepID=A0A8H7SVS0_9FUNG|nr:hypothetical protein INT48_007937 [Thamnidium elegans]